MPAPTPEPVVDPPAEVRAATPVAHALAMFTMVRGAEAWLYPEPFADFGSRALALRWKDAVTRPPLFDPKRRAFEWDGDPWTINVIGHGLMGSELYVRARACSFGWAGSLAFAAGASAVWEYAFEGNGVRPSALDLVYTPLAGLVLGEARYLLHGLARRATSTVVRRLATTAVDPFGELERAAGTDC